MNRGSVVACALAVCAAAAVAGSGAGAASAAGVERASIRIDDGELGVLRTVFVGRDAGRPVQFFERRGTRLRRLGSASAESGELAALDNAVTWSCRRRTRRFLATATLPGGSTLTGRGTARTPSCERRFRVRVQRRAAPRSKVTVRVADRWGNGAIRPTLCVISPRRRESCRRLVFPAAVTIATRSFRVGTRGTWRVRLRIGSDSVRRAIRVDDRFVAAASGPTVLATGDSMMLGLDRFLGDELAGRAQVIDDARLGRGISKSTADWTLIAGGQVLSKHPDTVVMLIGGAEGFEMITPEGEEVECCDTPWVDEYTRRVRVIMQTYSTNGVQRVFWGLMPDARDQPQQHVNDAVNAGILRAARDLDHVSIMRLDRLFTPDGYSDHLSYRGRRVLVRDSDGLHLNFRGQAISARLIAELIRISAQPTCRALDPPTSSACDLARVARRYGIDIGT